MAANAVQFEECGEACQESLADRMARGPLSLGEALRYATQLAAILRQLHQHGLAYGAVSSHLIVLGPSGAALRDTGGLTRLGKPDNDVTAFGAVLGEMLGRPASTDGDSETLRAEVLALARSCREQAPDMKQVLIGLRLLGLNARQVGRVVRRPMLVPRRPIAKPVEKLSMAQFLRVRLQLAMCGKSLAKPRCLQFLG